MTSQLRLAREREIGRERETYNRVRNGDLWSYKACPYMHRWPVAPGNDDLRG